MAARMAGGSPGALVDKVAALENPKIVRPYQLIARIVDEWDDEQLLEETADLIHKLLQEAAATGQLDAQRARMTQHSSA